MAEKQVSVWLAGERRYTLEKFGGRAGDDAHTRDEPKWWKRQIETYLDRAFLLGLETEAGRQALAKLASTALMATESAVRVNGPLPPPGVPSGQTEVPGH